MTKRRGKYLTLAMLLLLGFTAHIHSGIAHETKNAFTPVIPRTWDDQAMSTLELPLANPAGSPIHISADYYYRIPERPIYKSYPVYAPGKEPPGYEEWLKQQEPQIAFDASKLKTREDWIRAGEIVFDAPVFYNAVARVSEVRDPAWFEKTGTPVAKDGTAPFFHYVIREKGKIELGGVSCAMCHTRVTADGAMLKGAQGNYPFELATALSASSRTTAQQARTFERAFFAAPWVKPDTLPGLDQMSTAAIFDWHAGIPTGVIARQGTSPFYPPKIPDLIGIKDRKYLDHTGLQMHRSIADLMRYAALNQGASDLASFGGFIPAARRDFRTLPDPRSQSRYSDEQLYALALYLYSLKPPENPNRFDGLAKRGQKVFRAQGCALCHTPPLYTNNKLTPVDGFRVPADHAKRYDIMPVSVGTDAQLALKTRRGTGYYKVPSLRGVWYRGPFEHNGSVMTLEEWFDPKRLNDDYVPAGFKGYGVKTRAVKGHEFGLNLSGEDKKALIAFLKTL
ncbi:MAG TPA: hypothetical protein VF131_13250 [Blastocatellia bacterium]|nr:hypothetical protein [Blastocatellia bacterium]